MIQKTFSEVLECVLTQEEIRQKSEENTKRVLERATVKAAAKKSADAYTLKIKTLDLDIETTAKVLDEGKETRPVECEWQPDLYKRQMKAIRLDTFETLRRRDMDQDERREYFEPKLWESNSGSANPETNRDAVKEFFDDVKRDVVTPDEITIDGSASQMFTETESEKEQEYKPAPPDVLHATLAIVMENEVPIADIEEWTIDQRWKAQEWALAADTQKDGIDIDIPPMPEFLKKYVAAPDDLGGTPIPTQYNQAEMERIASFYCADKIAREEPVKICHVNGNPYVITSLLGLGPREITAYPILPLENVTEEGAAELRTKGEFYIGKKIKCGAKKKLATWVIVGPETTFKLKPKTDDESDEVGIRGVTGNAEQPREMVLDDKDDFTAPRCGECGRIDGAHASNCIKSDRLTYEQYLEYAEAHYKKNPATHARRMELNRDSERDAEIKEWLKENATKVNKATA